MSIAFSRSGTLYHTSGAAYAGLYVEFSERIHTVSSTQAPSGVVTVTTSVSSTTPVGLTLPAVGESGSTPWSAFYWEPPQLGGQFWTEFSRAREDATTLGVALDLGLEPPGGAPSELTLGDMSGDVGYINENVVGGGGGVGNLVPDTLAGRVVVTMAFFPGMAGGTDVQLALLAPTDVGDQESFSGGSLRVGGVDVPLAYVGVFPGPGASIYGFSGASATLPMPAVGDTISVALTLDTA